MHFSSERLLAFNQAYQIFRSELYRGNEHEEPILCNLHGAFGTEDSEAHNCLGCNFADLTIAFGEVLRDLSGSSSIQAPCMTFMLWLYLFVERYDQVMNYVSVPDGYKKRHFPTFQRLRRWANFVKHPKAFLFCHHPEYFHGGEVGDEFENPGGIAITSKFIDEFYAGGENNTKLAKALNNAANVIVVFPDPEALMAGFAAETKRFIDLIANNEVYREELHQISTIKNYFEQAHPDFANKGNEGAAPNHLG